LNGGAAKAVVLDGEAVKTVVVAPPNADSDGKAVVVLDGGAVKAVVVASPDADSDGNAVVLDGGANEEEMKKKALLQELQQFPLRMKMMKRMEYGSLHLLLLVKLMTESQFLVSPSYLSLLRR
jgi:hypothetical protein